MAGTEQEDARSIHGALDKLPHTTDIVGRDQTILPGQCGRVTGVVDQRRDDLALRVRYPSDQHRVISSFRGIEAHQRTPIEHEFPIRGQRASAGRPLDAGLGSIGSGLAPGVDGRRREGVEIAIDKLAAD